MAVSRPRIACSRVIATGFYSAAVAIAVGMCAQVAAQRIRVPSIVLLLLAGVAIGPDGLALIDVRAFGSALQDLVNLAVTVILFEGGLGLRIQALRHQQRSLVLLLTFGAAITMAGGTLAAHFVLGMSWSVSSLYGALMIVTGPTVVTPLLTRLRVDRPVKELLIGEGVLIDPIGAIVAIVVAEYVLGQSHALEAGWLVFVRLGLGGVIGAGTGLVIAAVLRREWLPESLRNPAVLGSVLLAAAFASRQSPEAGLMAAVAQGVTMGNASLQGLGRLRQFKEELTVLLLSFIFVLLAADLPLKYVWGLGWQALAVVALLIWVVRPLAVLLCTLGSGLSLGQRLFIAWICPRGIVAASVAGLFAILLDGAGMAGGDRLEALVFVTVGLTVVLQGLSARRVAHALGVDLPYLQGGLIVGADHFGRLMARLLTARGVQVVLIDSNPQHCRAARAEQLPVYCGDALAVEDLEAAGAWYADLLLAVTPNEELNTLIGQRARENFRTQRVLAIRKAAGEGRERLVFPGDFKGADEVSRQLRLGGARLAEYRATAGRGVGQRLGDLEYAAGEFALVLEKQGRPRVATEGETLDDGDGLVCLKPLGVKSPLASQLELLRETAPEAKPDGH